MSLADTRSACSSPAIEPCLDCDTSTSVTSELHKYHVACTCKSVPSAAQYACATDPGATSGGRKSDEPPALPPRPPPRPPLRPRLNAHTRSGSGAGAGAGVGGCGGRKYAWWCGGCGGAALALGAALAAAHAALRSLTASPHHLETVPAAVPAAMLVLTGLCIMSLARRRNRYSYMIKVVGACCLVCALTCVLVTITTTVIHMNRLQTLRECVFTQLTKTCTCYSIPLENQQMGEQDDSVRCVFEGVTDCGVVHGALYWCLRAVFALSFTAVLVCILSAMLAYQLLSHERKKMYWEQLELRCRSLYRPPSQAGNQGHSHSLSHSHSHSHSHSLGAPVPTAQCACCAWDITLQHQFWAPGRIGNLYSPNPGTSRRVSPWSWFPWARSNSQRWRTNERTERTVERPERFMATPTRCRINGMTSSGDSAYGFCDSEGNPNQSGSSGNPNGSSGDGRAAGGTQWGPPPPYSPQRHLNRQHYHLDPVTENMFRQHHMECHGNLDPNVQMAAFAPGHSCGGTLLTSPHRSSFHVSQANISHLGASAITQQLLHLQGTSSSPSASLLGSTLNQNMLTYNLPGQGSVRGHLVPYNCHQHHQISEPMHFVELGPSTALIATTPITSETDRVQTNSNSTANEDCLHIANIDNFCGDMNNVMCNEIHLKHSHLQPHCRNIQDVEVASAVLTKGKENMAYQTDKQSSPRRSQHMHLECQRAANLNAESEVYFADVSSCCNMSVKAMEYCSSANMSALVGTIENQPESTSGESDSGSLTVRRQRPQPQQASTSRRNRVRLPTPPETKFSPSARKCAQSSPKKLDLEILEQRESFLEQSFHEHSGPLDKSYKDQSRGEHSRSQSGHDASHFGPISPLTPATEESVLSDDEPDEELHRAACLGPDSQYESVKDEKQEDLNPKLPSNHQHCYSDTNTMDSGWQSGSEKHNAD